jgi:hypothetical protein
MTCCNLVTDVRPRGVVNTGRQIRMLLEKTKARGSHGCTEHRTNQFGTQKHLHIHVFFSLACSGEFSCVDSTAVRENGPLPQGNDLFSDRVCNCSQGHD